MSEDVRGCLKISILIQCDRIDQKLSKLYLRKYEISRDSRDRRGIEDSNDSKYYDDNNFNLLKSIESLWKFAENIWGI